MNRILNHAAILTCGLIVLSSASGVHASVSGTSISVEFGVGGSDGIGSGLAASDVAGVAPSANWNVASGDSGTMGSLVQDSLGTASATSVSVDWNSNNTWNDGNSFTGANNTLISGYLDGESGNVPATAAFSGLTSYSYTVVMYSAAGTDDGSGKESGGFYVNGTQVLGSGIGNTAGPNFIMTSPGVAGNYLVLSGVRPIGGAISISDDATSVRIPFNGVQLISTPEPASLVVWGLLGGIGLLVAARRRRRA